MRHAMKLQAAEETRRSPALCSSRSLQLAIRPRSPPKRAGVPAKWPSPQAVAVDRDPGSLITEAHNLIKSFVPLS
jgi:hypothetical protein